MEENRLNPLNPLVVLRFLKGVESHLALVAGSISELLKNVMELCG